MRQVGIIKLGYDMPCEGKTGWHSIDLPTSEVWALSSLFNCKVLLHTRQAWDYDLRQGVDMQKQDLSLDLLIIWQTVQIRPDSVMRKAFEASMEAANLQCQSAKQIVFLMTDHKHPFRHDEALPELPWDRIEGWTQARNLEAWNELMLDRQTKDASIRLPHCWLHKPLELICWSGGDQPEEDPYFFEWDAVTSVNCFESYEEDRQALFVDLFVGPQNDLCRLAVAGKWRPNDWSRLLQRTAKQQRPNLVGARRWGEEHAKFLRQSKLCVMLLDPTYVSVSLVPNRLIEIISAGSLPVFVKENWFESPVYGYLPSISGPLDLLDRLRISIQQRTNWILALQIGVQRKYDSFKQDLNAEN